MTPKGFVRSLGELKFDHVFNPYKDRCLVHDVSDAPLRRAKTLLTLLEAATESEVHALWIGRDLGHRGGRRTGLALTDDVHLATHAMRWNVSVQRATRGSMVAERTAAVIWEMLALVRISVFLWNVFPLHPYDAGDQFSNRSHNPQERSAGEDVLSELIEMLQPRSLVAIGNDAAKTVSRLAGTRQYVQIRHPSYGGQRDFSRQIRRLYNLPTNAVHLKLKSLTD